MDIDERLEWITSEADAFLKTEMMEMSLQKTLSINGSDRTYAIKLKRMMDVSEKYSGSLVIFSDITDMHSKGYRYTAKEVIQQVDEKMYANKSLKYSEQL